MAALQFIVRLAGRDGEGVSIAIRCGRWKDDIRNIIILQKAIEKVKVGTYICPQYCKAEEVRKITRNFGDFKNN